jgi:DNA-binding IclR family transcriptional regulator
MPSGAIRLVLQACHEMVSESDGWVLDADLARQTGLLLPEVRNCIESLDDQGYLRSARLTDELKAQITAEGRLFLSSESVFLAKQRRSPSTSL